MPAVERVMWSRRGLLRSGHRGVPQVLVGGAAGCSLMVGVVSDGVQEIFYKAVKIFSKR